MTEWPKDVQLSPNRLEAIALELSEEINRSLRLANMSDVGPTRRWRLEVARQRLERLKEMALSHPSLRLENLAAVEQSIKEISAETEARFPSRRPDDFLKRSLPTQCQILNLPLEDLELERTGQSWIVGLETFPKPEFAALAHYNAQGFQGTACEGTAVLMLMKCSCLDFLAEVNTFGSRADACTRYFEAQCMIHAERGADILREVRSATENSVRRNLREVFSQPNYATLYAALDEEAAMAIWTAITPEGMARLTELVLEDPYGRRAGWPDLTLARGSQLLFVEVKTTDRLHASQRAVIEDVIRPFGAEVRILRLTHRKS